MNDNVVKNINCIKSTTSYEYICEVTYLYLTEYLAVGPALVQSRQKCHWSYQDPSEQIVQCERGQ